ncbi:unnamed protein product [Urochloa humidicola]
MELRSGRRCLGTQPLRGAGRNCRPRRCRGGRGGVDHISELSATTCSSRSSSALAAAPSAPASSPAGGATSGIASSAGSPSAASRTTLSKPALAQALPKLFFLDIDISDSLVPAKDFASVLRAAARLDPVELRIVARWVVPMPPIELPSFARATSITLNAIYLHLAPPSADLNLPVLQRLSITKSSGRFNSIPMRALITQCPRLRVLELVCCWDLDCITVHSATIEELLVIGELQLQSVDIMAPMLKKFTLHGLVSVGFRLSLLAPMVLWPT